MNDRDWIWEDPDWTNFKYDSKALDKVITKFDFNNQITLTNSILFENSEDDEFVVEIQGLEAIKTSEIEGEIYQLPQIINSIRSGFNILANTHKEKNSQSLEERRSSVSAMMVDLYKNFQNPLGEDTLNGWNTMLTSGKKGASNEQVGHYREYEQAMEIGSGEAGSKPHYVAPPSSVVRDQMDGFIKWFNDTGKEGKAPLHPLIRSALAHLYFVSIHPYDDGNGRIARALSVKAISEANEEPTLISLSHAISENKNDYYEALKAANHDVGKWLEYFCNMAIRAQEITKIKLYQTAVVRTVHKQHEDALNVEQVNAIGRLVSGDGVKKEGVISVKEYTNVNIDTLRARAKLENKPFKEIAQNDISELIELGLLTKSKRQDCEKYVFVYPTTHGVSAVKTSTVRSDDPPYQKKEMRAQRVSV